LSTATRGDVSYLPRRRCLPFGQPPRPCARATGRPRRPVRRRGTTRPRPPPRHGRSPPISSTTTDSRFLRGGTRPSPARRATGRRERTPRLPLDTACVTCHASC
jgi:hypothetical protein